MSFLLAIPVGLGVWYLLEDIILRASPDPSRLAPLFPHRGYRRS
jgi:hypothetical protein